MVNHHVHLMTVIFLKQQSNALFCGRIRKVYSKVLSDGYENLEKFFPEK